MTPRQFSFSAFKQQARQLCRLVTSNQLPITDLLSHIEVLQQRQKSAACRSLLGNMVLAKRKMRSKALAAAIGITEQNISLLKSGKVKGIRFETLAKICAALECQPGDILETRPAP